MSLVKIAGAALLSAASALVPTAFPAYAAQPRGNHPAAAGTVVLDCLGAARTRPRSYLLACGDGNNYLTGLRWSTWGGKSATAKGTDVANDCLPYCAAGHFHAYPSTVVLDRPQAWTGHPGANRFTRLTLHYTGRPPTGSPRTVTITLPAGPG